MQITDSCSTCDDVMNPGIMCRRMLLATTLLSSIVGYAQLGTNPTPILTTNAVAAASSYRVVTGQLYNIQRSVLWSNFTADYVQDVTDGILAQPFELRPVYRTNTMPGGTVGAFFFGTGGKTISGYEKVFSRPIVLRNYTAAIQDSSVGQVVRVRAMKVGTSGLGAETYELWDCGAPHILHIVRTNWPPSSATN
jgi:hypothetical protein